MNVTQIKDSLHTVHCTVTITVNAIICFPYVNDHMKMNIAI